MAKRFQGQKVLVTGGGSGIGRETVRAFAREGAHVIAVDIADAGLRETAAQVAADGGHCETHRADVSDEAAMRALADTVHKAHGALDVLINNAGIAAAGRFIDTQVATWDRVMGINVRGVMLGCHAFLPPMIERRRGHIVNLSSMCGYFASPDLPVYTASKFAVLGFSESLRADLKDHGIGVSAICPGIINTNIVATSTAEGSSAKWMGDAVDFYAQRNYPPSKVADAILKAVARNRAVVPVSPEAWVGYYVMRLWPWLARRLAATQLPFQKKP